MTASELSAHAENSLALRRTLFQPDPRRGGQDQRRLAEGEKAEASNNTTEKIEGAEPIAVLIRP
jgi:hypothetical protein